MDLRGTTSSRTDECDIIYLARTGIENCCINHSLMSWHELYKIESNVMLMS